MRLAKFNLILSLAVIAAGLAVSYVVFAQDQANGGNSGGGIVFPIAELGNCGSEGECRDYCDKPQNMSACIAFAKSHGLVNENEAEKAEKFAEKVVRGEGPGGCRGPKECNAFCSQVENIEACVAFAEEHGLEGENLSEAKKIRVYIVEGGKMPGGCNSKESCEAYCSDFNHAEECFAFAEKAGLNVAEGSDKIPAGQFQRFVELAKKGETPGQCKSKDECETYCRNSANFEECVSFGEKLGFIKPEQAEMIRKTGGKGPGGCNSEESCRAYCNDSTRQEECFRFAEEHGLIPEEELKHAKDGLVRLRQGLENAPPEVVSCLKSVLGQNIIEDIQSGKIAPGPAIGERVKACFEKFGEKHDPRQVFSDAPPEVISCVKEKLGDTFERVRSGNLEPTPEVADTFRVCFQNVKFERTDFEKPSGLPPTGITDFLRTAPPGVQVCLKEKLGTELQALERGDVPFGAEVTSRIKACFEEFRPTDEPIQKASPLPVSNFTNLPPEVLECVKSAFGVDIVERIKRGDVGPEIGERVKVCHEKLRSNVAPPSTAAPTPVKGTVCIQVITPAYNPETGECKNFPTPCDVPSDWHEGCPTDSSNTLGTTDFAERCEDSGGKWDGKTCFFPDTISN